jgi:hypothetical protein
MGEFVLYPVKKTGARLRIRNIRLAGLHPQLIRSRGERRRIAARNCNASAFGNKSPCRREAVELTSRSVKYCFFRVMDQPISSRGAINGWLHRSRLMWPAPGYIFVARAHRTRGSNGSSKMESAPGSCW